MQYDDEVQQHEMVEGESSGEKLYDCSEASLEPCADTLFCLRQYVLLSRQKDIFQNWPFAEKYLRLCLKYGVTNVLPPLEARDFPERMSISYEREKVSGTGDNNDQASFELTLANVCEKIELMSLSCNDQHKQENRNHSEVHIPNKKAARKAEKSRKGRRKMKSMAEIFATAKYRTLEEEDVFNDLNWTSDSITPDNNTREHKQKFDQADFECYCDSKSEFTNDDADHNNRLSKRRRALKSCSKSSSSSNKAIPITKNRSGGYNRKTQEIYGPKSAFELQDAHIC